MASDSSENKTAEEIHDDEAADPDRVEDDVPAPEAGDSEEPPFDDHGGQADGAGHLWFLAAALVTVLVLLAIIVSTRAWDVYLCDTDADCRGLKECIEGHCVSPEVWQREHPQESQTTE